jgi:endogenous inhibitor of DNA gyrase (YacG/DUF329 family)
MVGRVVRCPTCGGDSVYATSNSARPFCSERCKNMDFGAWASENFRVAAPDMSEDIEPGNSNLH